MAMSLSGMDLSETPSGMPPPGQVPNFVNPPSRAGITTVIVSVTLALMIVFVTVRVYADVWVLRKMEKAGCACFLCPYKKMKGDFHRARMLILLQGCLLLQWYEDCANALYDESGAYHTQFRQHPSPTVQ